MISLTLSIFSAPNPGKLNEDAYVSLVQGETALLAVFDGTTQRLKARRFAELLAGLGPGWTTARLAAQLAASTLVKQASAAPDQPLSEMLLAVNDVFRAQFEGLYGELSAEALLRDEPDLDLLREDPRYLRLALPSCAATLARIDLAAGRLAFAHAGDTALISFGRGGAARLHTQDQIGGHDARTLQTALALQRSRGAAHLSDVLDDPTVQQINLRNRIYHNYLDHSGQPDPAVGVGVLNGLPALAHYIQAGEMALDEVEGLLLCTDGFLWPAPAGESPAQQAERLGAMRAQITGGGLAAYAERLRAAEDADPHHDRWPRIKPHDDITALLAGLA